MERTLEGIEIAVVGIGASGRAAARLAMERGGRAYVTDLKSDAETSAAGDELRRLGAGVELGGHRLDRLVGADTVVVSPGIPPDAPVLADLRRSGVRWISELEFAFRFIQGPLIAVTGTNGKTTTAALTAHLLRESGLRVGLGGNIGAKFGPAASELALLEPVPDVFVVEASSFQLADIEEFEPEIGVVTNLAPDHLDRYPDTRTYYADKARLFENASSESEWVLNGDDPAVLALAGDSAGSRHLFSVGGRVEGREKGGLEDSEEAEAYLEDGELVLRADTLLPADELPLLGRHNVANALAAALTTDVAAERIARGTTRIERETAGRARETGRVGNAAATPEEIARGLRSFSPLPHRLESLGEHAGVLWINDSKATNVSATLSAVGSLDRPVVLLLGGKDKGEDFGRLRKAIGSAGGGGATSGGSTGTVRAAVIYGAARARIASALEDAVPLWVVDESFEEAVAAGERLAEAGDILLLSPACSSYDMFSDYEARGNRFRELAGSTK